MSSIPRPPPPSDDELMYFCPLTITVVELVVMTIANFPQYGYGQMTKKPLRLYTIQGVHGRNSDNTLIEELLGWQPRVAIQ